MKPVSLVVTSHGGSLLRRGRVCWKETVSLHGEYVPGDLDERRRLAKEEIAALKKWLGGGRTTP